MEKTKTLEYAETLTIENGEIVRKRSKKNNKKLEVSGKNVIDLENEAISSDPTLTPEIEANTKIFYEYFQLEYAKSLARNVLTPIEKYYFRAEFIGFEGDEFPKRNDPKRPLIFASNHSGMAFPWDGIIFGSGLLRINGYEIGKAARGLASPMLSMSTLMNPFLIPNFWKRAGGIDATTLNFDTMMHFSEANILIYPEGIEGIGKGFDKKYQLQRLATSALRMSLKYKTDIIPFATVNAEYINPFSYSIDWLNDIVRQAGVPFLPIGASTILALLQPWMFYFAFPAKLTFVRGRRIKPYEMLNKPFEEITREDLYYLRDRIQRMMQNELDQAVREYGQKPYDWLDFFKTIANNWHKAPYFLPMFWPFVFIDHEKRWQELQAKLAEYSGNTPEELQKRQALWEEHNHEPQEESLFSMVQTAVNLVRKNPEVLIMYIPVVGWIPTLMKGFEKKGK